MQAVDVAVASGARLFKACEAIQLGLRKLRRWRKNDEDGRKGGYRAWNQKLNESEKDAIVSALNLPGIDKLPLKVAHATLMDMGICLASASSFARVIKERSVPRNKPPRRTRKPKRPELVATGPGQVWCWDITWLEAPTKGTYFYLYMIIDMFSRKVVGQEVYAKEDGNLARGLFAQALADEGIPPGQIKVHADNGKPMRSKKLRGLFDMLNVTASYGRPHTSNDNAFAESLFATFKGRVSFPEYFPTIAAARDYCLEFFTWYNCMHLHSNLDFVTPQSVHEGTHIEVYEKRNALLKMNRLTHPSRHGGKGKNYAMSAEVRLKHRTEMTIVA
jgi:transposase InsO family protein